ncbi:MAG: diguanylate cyclase [Proteobacteria bacterium]|nr:diguanylate cyclase [Pseudomonadota bacterium]
MSQEILTLKSAKILIAATERRFSKSLQQLLVLQGYQSCIALTAEEVVALLDQCTFEVIVLDLKVVEIGGLETMEQIKGRQKTSKLIMLSNDFIFDQAVWALRQGAHDFFRTPYSPDELLSSIHNMLAQKVLTKSSQRKYDKVLNSELLHRYMVNNSPDVIYLLDQDGQFSFFNKQVTKLLGFSREELLGKHYSILIFPEDLEKSRYVFSERRTGQRAAKNIELRLQQKKKGLSHVSFKPLDVYVELYATGVYKNGKEIREKTFLGTYGVVRDISERKETEKQFHHQLYHDALTNLPNRSLFQDRLRLALCQTRRYKQSLAVMFLDIDGFKGINDSFGHALGDALLQAFSVRLKSCLREGDTLARISGDEFTILIPKVSSRKDTNEIARKVIAEFKVPFNIEGLEMRIGVSIGIALAPGDSDSDEELMQNADLAMYYVKHHGKNGFAYYEDSEPQLTYTFPLVKRRGLKAIMKN